MVNIDHQCRERPILFKGDMVRAILSGAKVQTRRAVKGIPWRDGANPSFSQAQAFSNAGEFRIAGSEEMTTAFRCPFGQPGDRLWVRETWRPSVIHCCFESSCDCDSVGVTYSADGQWIHYGWQNGPDDDWTLPTAAERGNVPSIHMPRWACRLVLEITAVRVERLQAISEADAIAEGTTPSIVGDDLQHLAHRAGFQTLWTSTGGDWDSNPWVWVIEFKRVEHR